MNKGINSALLSASCALVLAAPAAQAGTLATTANLGSQAKSETGLDLPLQPSTNTPVPVPVAIRIKVPNSLRPSDTVTAYPYPVRPPVVSKFPDPLPTKRNELEGALLGTGYANRMHERNPYLALGWRWRYAFNKAVRKSHRALPVTIFGAYPWSREMVKYILPEVLAVNAAEENRKQCYTRVVEIFENEGADLEAEASRAGLYPVEVRIRQGQGAVKLQPGKWWITGTRTVVGLVYYWELPVNISGERAQVELNQSNALLVQGSSW